MIFFNKDISSFVGLIKFSFEILLKYSFTQVSLYIKNESLLIWDISVFLNLFGKDFFLFVMLCDLLICDFLI